MRSRGTGRVQSEKGNLTMRTRRTNVGGLILFVVAQLAIGQPTTLDTVPGRGAHLGPGKGATAEALRCIQLALA